VIQRGKPGLPVLPEAVDRADYLEALDASLRDSGVAIHAYALLEDAVMLLATPRQADDLGRFMQRVNRRYVSAFHRRHGTRGSIWGSRFQAAAIEPEHYLLPAILLVEQAPVRAGLVAGALDWSWSSAAHHAGRGASTFVTDHASYWRVGNTPFEREARHAAVLQQALGVAVVEALLAAVRGGWPHGSAAFVDALGDTVGRALRPRPRGRPRKESNVGTEKGK
jgi:putative transposase